MTSDKRASSRCYPSTFFFLFVSWPKITDLKVFASPFYSVVPLLPVHTQVHIHRRTKSRRCVYAAHPFRCHKGETRKKKKKTHNICGVLCSAQSIDSKVPYRLSLPPPVHLFFLLFSPGQLISSSQFSITVVRIQKPEPIPSATDETS